MQLQNTWNIVSESYGPILIFLTASVPIHFHYILGKVDRIFFCPM